MHVLTCETIMVRRYEARSVKSYWTEDSRTAQLCNLTVRVVNADSHCIMGKGEPLVYEVTGTPQQIAQFESVMTHDLTL